MTSRKPPPLFAVFNETKGVFAFWSDTQAAAERELEYCRKHTKTCEYRLVTLTEQPETPQ